MYINSDVIDLSKYNCWKVLETVASNFNFVLVAGLW